MTSQVWKSIVGYEGAYEVSNFGEVRSLDRYVDGKLGSQRKIKGKLLKIKIRNHREKKYRYVILSHKNKSPWTIDVHRLVAMHFLDDYDENLVVRHGINGIEDNSVHNLEMGTHSENMQDKLRDGTNFNHNKNECIRGHEFNDLNSRVSPSGKRVCRLCESFHYPSREKRGRR
jgi:hypothetical protein